MSASCLSTHLSKTMSKFLLYSTSPFKKKLPESLLRVFLSLFDAPKRVLLSLKEAFDVVEPRFIIDDCFSCKHIGGPFKAHNSDFRHIIPMIDFEHGR